MGHFCGICNRVFEEGPDDIITADNGRYHVFFCPHCRVGITIPVPPPDELSRLYALGSYRAAGGKRFNPFVEIFIYLSRLARKKRIEKFVRKGKILDIGCGRGLFLNVMKKSGWEVAGAEFSKETALAAAEAYGLDVVSGDIGDWGLPAGSFDVVVLNHVLEHVRAPAAMLGECGKLLRQGGLLVIAVPDMYSLQAAFGKELWFHLDIPYHLYHFTEEGLSALLGKHSFAVARVRRLDLEYNLFGWLQTLLNRSGIKKNLFYNLLKRPELRKTALAQCTKQDLLLTLVLLPLYFPLALCLSGVESFLLRRGGTVEFYAIKQ